MFVRNMININDAFNLQLDLNRFLKWYTFNGLSLNVDKCISITFGCIRSQLICNCCL